MLIPSIVNRYVVTEQACWRFVYSPAIALISIYCIKLVTKELLLADFLIHTAQVYFGLFWINMSVREGIFY